MWRRWRLVVLPLVALGCGHKSPVAVPRPRAYPRVALHGAAYRAVAVDGMDSLRVNAAARVSERRPGWVDIDYPDYGMAVNCTLTRGGDIRQALANRAERMALNVGDAAGEVAQFRSRSGLHVTVLTVSEALRTPLQFVATDSATMIFSGAAVGNFAAGADPDSVAPLIEAVGVDLFHMLRNL